MNKKTRIFVAAAVIFLSGFVAGVISEPAVHFVIMEVFRPKPPSPEHFREKVCNRISDELKLNREQSDDLRKKLEPRMEAFAAEHKNIKNSFGKMIDATLMEIQPALSPEQIKIFEKIKKEREEHDSKYGMNEPPPPPPMHRPPPPPFGRD